MASAEDIASVGLGLAIIGGSVWVLGKTMDAVNKHSSKAFKWL